jgi:hypothetical protein
MMVPCMAVNWLYNSGRIMPPGAFSSASYRPTIGTGRLG